MLRPRKSCGPSTQRLHLLMQANLLQTKRSQPPLRSFDLHEAGLFAASAADIRESQLTIQGMPARRSHNPSKAAHDVIERIRRSPQSAPQMTQRSQVRVVSVVRYPFRIFYRIRGDAIGHPAHPTYFAATCNL